MPSVSSTDTNLDARSMPRPVFMPAQPRAVAARLDTDSIHLWRIEYDPGERRAPLRRMLAAYLGVAASAIEWREGEHGKPGLRIPGTVPPTQLQFNWSHSGDYALIALARGVAVGVDIERIGKPSRALEVARRFFAPSESAALAAVGATACNPAFTGLWCAKEAVLKAVGSGLSFGLERLTFTHRGGSDWDLTEIDPALGDPAAWQVPGFAAAPGYRGAVAWQGAPRALRAFQPVWPEVAEP